jgi:hypothetical protein
MAGRQDVMQNPGLNEDQHVRLDVVIDRSGSVTGSPPNNEGQQAMAKMFGYMDKEARGKIPTSIYGFDGGGGRTGHFAYKEAHSSDLTSIDGLIDTGGGGTPTADGVEFSRARLARSSEKHRVMIVITDGQANDNSEAYAQCMAARAEGITVLGLAFVSSDSGMDEIFGRGNWVKIDNYQKAPRLVGKLITDIAGRARGRGN